MRFNQFYGDKVVIVTGGSAGIGKKMANLLLEYGAHVIITGRNRDNLEKAVDELSVISERVGYFAGDVSNYNACLDMAAYTVEKFGQIDVLINNAGMAQNGRLEDIHDSIVSDLIDINLKGPIYTSKACIPHLRKQNGYILFVSSVAGIHGLPDHGIYSTSKMGLRSVVETLRFELGKDVGVGISYVGFTQNDPGKVMFDSKGQLMEVPGRPGNLVFSQEKTATLILKQIKDNKYISNPSFLGKFLNWMKSLSPRFTHWLMRQVNKKRA